MGDMNDAILERALRDRREALEELAEMKKDAAKGWYEAKMRGEILDVIAPGWRKGGDMDQMRALAAGGPCPNCRRPMRCPDCG